MLRYIYEETSHKKPRIAFIVPDKIQNPIGGMGVQAKFILKHLKKDFDFDIYAFPEENNIPNYHSCPNQLNTTIHPGLSTIGGQITYLTEIIKNKKPDLIHVSDYTIYLAGVMASRAYNVPLVVSVQLSTHLMEQVGLTFANNINTIDGMAIHNTMKKIELLGLNEAQKIIHVSNFYKTKFSENPDFDKKSVYIPNGIDLQDYSMENPNYKKVHLPGTRKLKVVYLGRFAPQKNIHELNNAQVPDSIDLVHIGKEESGSELFRNMFDKSILKSNIHYYGPAYDSEKINLLHAADAVIIPSVHECHPIVMHESMAAGCVVIHSGAGDMDQILTDDFAINCGVTSESITNALDKFATMKPEEIKRRKNISLETVKNYTWESAAKQTKGVYYSVLKN